MNWHSYRIQRNVDLVLFLAMILHWLPTEAQETKTDKDLDNRTIVAASNMLHPPFSSWGDNNKAVGIEVDIVDSAAAESGCVVEWIERPFPELFDAISSGEIDVAVSTIGITEERKKKVAFSIPYYQTQIVALVRPDSKIKSLDQLSQGRIGADQTTTSSAAAKKQWPKATFVGAASPDLTWPQMIEQGHIDAFIVDASDQQRLESIDGVKLRRIDKAISVETFSIAMKKKAVDLKAAIDRAVKIYKPTVQLRIGGEYQFTTPLGTRISSLSNSGSELVAKYVAAKNRHRQTPDNPDALIWYGRRAGYLLRMNEAIQIFSVGVGQHPDDPRMYRHRGHRYISTRQFEKAIADLEQAVKLIDGKRDKIEPDGAPNAQGIQLTTLHGNIWYHLGLAYYLKNDLANALRCFRECQKLNRNDDGVVSSAHWLYMILRRQSKQREADELVADIEASMNIIENTTYHQMCLFYAAKISESELLKPASAGTGTGKNEKEKLSAPSGDRLRQSVADVLLYGTGNWYLYDRNDKQQAKKLFQSLLQSGSPFSFALIAAESDYTRLFAE